MAKPTRLQPTSVLVGLLGALVLIALVGATSAETRPVKIEPQATTTTALETRAALPAADLAFAGGRRGSNTPPGPNNPIYTVPMGRTLVIRAVTVVGYSSTTGSSTPIGANVVCGGTLLIPREIVGSAFSSLTAGGTFDLGWVCPAGSNVTLTGPAVNPLIADSIGWTMLGELQ